MTFPHSMRRILAAASIVLLGAAACSSDEDPADNEGGDVGSAVDANADDAADGEAAADIDSGDGATQGLDGDYSFGLGKESMPGVFETTFSSDNAKARWDGDTMIIEMDGDVESTTAHINCSAVSSFLLEGDTLEFRYPNGVFECD